MIFSRHASSEMSTMNEDIDSLSQADRPASHMLTQDFVTTPESWKDQEMLDMRKLTCRHANELEKPRIRG